MFERRSALALCRYGCCLWCVASKRLHSAKKLFSSSTRTHNGPHQFVTKEKCCSPPPSSSPLFRVLLFLPILCSVDVPINKKKYFRSPPRPPARSLASHSNAIVVAKAARVRAFCISARTPLRFPGCTPVARPPARSPARSPAHQHSRAMSARLPPSHNSPPRSALELPTAMMFFVCVQFYGFILFCSIAF